MSFITRTKERRPRIFLQVSIILLLAYGGKAFSQTPINLNLPVGMTETEAGSNGSGGSVYTIPIEIPAGVNGMQPQVSVGYSSQGSGNGFSGHGWALSPVSLITRAGKNYFNNGLSTPVDYTGNNDAFLLDGQRLMLISGTAGANGAVYGTEQEQFSKIEAVGGDGNSPASFKVTTKNGLVLEYGTDNMKMLTNDGTRVMFWALRKVIDPSGNYMMYDYTFDNTNRFYFLSGIRYAGNGTKQPDYQILFTYVNKADWQTAPVYMAGASITSPKLLDRIDVKEGSNQIRSYAFAYQYLRKKYFLTTVTEAGANGTALNPITFTYGDNPSASFVSLTGEYGYSTNQNNVGDFDGDGRQDIQTYAYRYNTSNGESWFRWYQIYDYNNGSIGGKYSYSMETDIPDSDVKVMGNAAQNPFTVYDFDGDGKDDVFLAKFNKNSYNLNGVNINYSRVSMGLNTKYVEYKKMQYNSLPSSLYGQHSLWKQGGSFFVSGDFDGDGHADYILILGINGYSNAYKAFLSSPSKNIFNAEILNFGVGVNGATGEFAANAVAESKAIVPINFDGDGKTDLLVTRNEASYVMRVFPIPASSGYQYACEVVNSTTEIKTDYKIYPGDFNGDGNTDVLVRQSSNDANGTWKVLYSTGKAFTAAPFNWAYKIVLPGDGYSNGHMLAVGDYDGDGKSDIWHSLDASGSSSIHVAYYFNGSTSTFESTTLNASTNTESQYVTGDFNGDAKPDLLKVRNASATSFYVKFLLAKPFAESNLLVGASNLGHLTNFDYGLLNNMDNSGIYVRTQGDFSYNDLSDPQPYIRPYVVPAPAMYALSRISRPNGIGYQSNEYYTYEDAIIHTEGRGFLGYGKTDIRNDMGIVRRAWNKVDLPYSMLVPDVTQTHLNTGGILTRSRFTTSFKQVSASSYLNKRFFMKTDRVHTKNWLTNEASETLNTYDDNGNVTQSILNVGTSDDFNITSVLETATSTSTFGTYAGAPYPAFQTSLVLKKTRTGQPQINKTTNYTYTPLGLRESVTDNAGTPIATTVTNVYNNFGLPTQSTTVAPGVATPVLNYVYDATGRFLLEKKATGGGIVKKETKTYDSRFGIPLTESGADGLVTSYQYDEFGKVNRVTAPDGNVVTTTKSWETTDYNRFSVTTQRLDGTNKVKAYFDILSREIKMEKSGFNNLLLTSVKNYNYYGQLASESKPTYPGEPVNYTYSYYDGYGRLSSRANNFGTVTVTYSGAGGSTYTQQDTRGNNQWTSKTTDAAGRVIASSDNGVNMAFTYDSYGNQLTAGSNGQTFITNTYDVYGRQLTQTDASSGTNTYEYNAIGQTIKQTDAKGNVQTMSYDVFGRLSTNINSLGTTTYTYYNDAAAGKSSDKITQIVGYGGDVRTFQLDNFQRMSSETRVAGGVSLTKSYTYDAKGNVSTVTYPAGFLIRTIYDNNGIVSQVKYEQGATVKNLFTATSMNSRGLYTSYSTGNGKTKEATWDYMREAPGRYYTAGIQDLNMTYEVYTANLLSRRDAIRNLTENFSYDVTDKLISARVNGVQQFGITYDGGAQGKILQKTDIGNYNYNPAKIHAPADLSAINGGTDPNTVIGTQALSITYTPFSKAETISENGNVLTYKYGSDQQRITSELKLNGTLVETRSYWDNMESRTVNGVSSEIYYINAGNGLNNIIVKQNGNINIYYAYTDHVGSILTLTNEAGAVVAEQNFDAWGRRRNPTNWTYAGVPAVPDWLIRGYTGHEHMSTFTLINMNGRIYDPITATMLTPDNYVSNPFSPSGYNRYLYANGNPLKFVDPSGDNPIVVAAIIGAIVGAYTGGVMANDGQYNPGKWDYQSGRTWGYMIGGAIVGAASGAAGGAIASTSGLPFANTLGIAASSLINSVGTAIYTGGQTDITFSIGFASFNFSTGELGYLFKKGNSALETIGYTFGALANLQDIFAGVHGISAEYRAEGGGVPHARVVNKAEGVDVSVAHVPIDPNVYKQGASGIWESLDYARVWSTRIFEGVYYPTSTDGATLPLFNVNGKLLKAMTDNINPTKPGVLPKGLWGIGKLKYGTTLFGCQSHVAHALWRIGIPTLPINIHPLVLWTQLAVRQAGIIGSPMLINTGH